MIKLTKEITKITNNINLIQEGRGEVTDISASPGRQAPANQLRPKEPPPMVIQGDFRKVHISIMLILFKYLLKAYLFFSSDYFICQRIRLFLFSFFS